MTSNTYAILCGACKSRLKTVPNPKPHDKVTCEGCGRSDRFDDMMAAVQEHVVHLTQESISKRLAAAARGSRFLKYTPQKLPNRSFRWIIEGGL